MTDARAAIHAMVNLSEYGETVLDQRLDALVAEVRRTDAAYLLDQRHHHLHRAIFCDGIKYSARLLKTRAGETTEKATAPAATATPDAEAYDGELAMARGLIRVLRTVARQDDLREVQRLLIEHTADETAAYAERRKGGSRG